MQSYTDGDDEANGDNDFDDGDDDDEGGADECGAIPDKKSKQCADTCSQEVKTVDDHEEVWVTVGSTMLFLEDKADILRGKCLTDNILFAAQQLLHQQFPAISGLQDPCLQQTLTFEEQKNRDFVRCLNVRGNMKGNHWITVSSVGCKAGIIRVYDSMNLMSESAMKILADLVHTESNSFTIEYMNMQCQISAADSGLIAIASACSICNGEDPSGCMYNWAAMRQHLVTAFETGLLSPFPMDSEADSVFLTCQFPDGRMMVECSQCKEWYHSDFIANKLKCSHC